MKAKVTQTQDNARLIDEIADCLLEDHIELMNENAALRAEVPRPLRSTSIAAPSPASTPCRQTTATSNRTPRSNECTRALTVRFRETLTASLRELLDEHHPRECWSDETIEYEIQEGNMGALIVKRAYAALKEKKMNLREAAQQAIHALETKGEHHPRVYEAITALRAALEQPEQEPYQRLLEAVEREREECALLCEEHWSASECADSIRARGQA